VGGPGKIGPCLHLQHSAAHQIKKVNRTTRVCSLALGAFLVSLCLASRAAAQAEDQTQHLRTYTVSLEQLKVSSRIREHLLRAQKHFRKADLGGALREVQSALSEDPGCPAALTMRAFIKLAAKDSAGAIADSAQATLIDGNDAEAFLALATAYNFHLDFAAGEQAARQALRLEPGLWQAQLEVGKSLYGQGKLLPALGELRTLQTDFADVHLVRGSVLMALGRTPEATAEFERFLGEAPADPRCARIKQIVTSVNSPSRPRS
jgi:tetratricopeptide (TPR) repeat protein